jgi:hypothetical protein
MVDIQDIVDNCIDCPQVTVPIIQKTKEDIDKEIIRHNRLIWYYSGILWFTDVLEKISDGTFDG